LTYSGSASVEIPLLFKKKNAQSATDSGADERVLIKENGFIRPLTVRWPQGQFFNRRLKTVMTMESGREGDNGQKKGKKKLK